MIRDRSGKCGLPAMALGGLLGRHPASPASVPVAAPKAPLAKPKSKLTEPQAIEIARDATRPRDVDPTEHDEPTVEFRGGQWSLFFQLKASGESGGFFLVIVDDRTGRTVIAPGH